MKKSRIYAHRGYSEKYPENSLLAFRKAFEHGADGVECDLQKCGDGQYIVLHDDAVERTALNKTGKISTMTLVELKACDLGAEQTIPGLREMLTLIPARKYLNLELKPETITAEDCPVIYESVRQYVKKEYLMISSNEPALLTYFKKQGITTGYIIEDKSRNLGVTGVLRLIFKYNPAYLNLPVQIFTELGTRLACLFIRFMQLCGKRILFWTVNTEEDVKKVRRFTKEIITDRVEFLLGQTAGGSQAGNKNPL